MHVHTDAGRKSLVPSLVKRRRFKITKIEEIADLREYFKAA